MEVKNKKKEETEGRHKHEDGGYKQITQLVQ